jgi:cytochrome c-type biogenesis protein CcmE
MKTRHKRLALIVVGLAGLGIATALILNAFRSNLVFYFTPTQVYAGEAPTGQPFRVGGLVEKGSVQRNGSKVTFVVTDLNKSLTIHYDGILPDLFREGQGVIAQGRLDGARVFTAQQVLAKHDEKYMPPEVAKSLKGVSTQ